MKRNNSINSEISRKSESEALKVEKLEYKILKMQEYFLPNELNVYKDEIHLIFQLRCQETRLKILMKVKFA